MHSALKILTGKNMPGRVNWRLRTAAVGAAAIMGTGIALAAAPSASADTVEQTCSTYHQWTLCVSYDYTSHTIAMNALNGYSNAGVETLTIAFTDPDGNHDRDSDTMTIPAHSWRGFGVYNPVPPGAVCGLIDTAASVCGSFN